MLMVLLGLRGVADFNYCTIQVGETARDVFSQAGPGDAWPGLLDHFRPQLGS